MKLQPRPVARSEWVGVQVHRGFNMSEHPIRISFVAVSFASLSWGSGPTVEDATARLREVCGEKPQGVIVVAEPVAQDAPLPCLTSMGDIQFSEGGSWAWVSKPKPKKQKRGVA